MVDFYYVTVRTPEFTDEWKSTKILVRGGKDSEVVWYVAQAGGRGQGVTDPNV